jgi:hypothetical protein
MTGAEPGKWVVMGFEVIVFRNDKILIGRIGKVWVSVDQNMYRRTRRKARYPY